jgi:hypothetical protein
MCYYYINKRTVRLLITSKVIISIIVLSPVADVSHLKPYFHWPINSPKEAKDSDYSTYLGSLAILTSVETIQYGVVQTKEIRQA